MTAAATPSTDLNLVRLLEAHARERPERAALMLPRRFRDDGRGNVAIEHEVVTYSELALEVRRTAGGLRALGIGAGDRVVVMVPMSRALYALVLALIRIGATIVFIDPWVGLGRLDGCIRLVGPKAFVGVALTHALRFLSPAFRAIPRKIAAGRGATLLPGPPLDELAAHGDATLGAEVAAVTEDTTALITFTTGSTGTPKGAVRTHGFLFAQHEALTHELGTRPDDVDLTALPIFVLNNLANGITSVIPRFDPRRPGAVDPRGIVAQIEASRVTTAAASPAFFEPVARYCRERKRTLPTVRAIFTGGAPVRPALLEALREAAPAADAAIVYGSTEAEPISKIDAREVLGETAALTRAGRGSCVGRPAPEARVLAIAVREGPIDAPAGGVEALAVPPGEPGEIVVAGRHVNKRYFQNEKAVRETKIRDRDGEVWHRTGDVGYFDAQGRIWLVGRTNSIVRRGGRTHHPLEVEPVVEQCAAVERAALVGLPGGAAGERAAIVVVPRENSWLKRFARRAEVEREVRAFCAEKGLPCDDVIVVGGLPLDPRHNAKIDHNALKRRFATRGSLPRRGRVGERESPRGSESPSP